MNPLILANDAETYDFCRDHYEGFNSVSRLMTDYQKHAGEFEEHGSMAEIDFSDQEESHMDNRHLVMTSNQFADYLKHVFKPVFRNHPEAYRVIGVLHDQIEHLIDVSPIHSSHLSQLTTLLKSRTPLEHDFITLLISLSAAHLYRLRHGITELYQNEDAKGDNTCPTCGLVPHFSQLRGEEGFREMECWLCGTRWLSSRLECLQCGEKEQKQLGYFVTDEIPDCRIHFCRSCASYTKAFDLRQRSVMDPNLWILHLASLYMDDLAAMEGFQPASAMIWNHAGAVLHQKR
ncbi:MAG: formate dehydrogenase accessory protein FdhE [Bacillota bacterium]|nr:formate dehydrogenase accessory protein FdhE [Bacillota bacterium]MDW7677848.1 formate dehydrogenase accessory protein FdhE [Bacillota bacterium]